MPRASFLPPEREAHPTLPAQHLLGQALLLSAHGSTINRYLTNGLAKLLRKNSRSAYGRRSSFGQVAGSRDATANDICSNSCIHLVVVWSERVCPIGAVEIVGAQDDSIAGYASALGQVGSVDGNEVTFTAPLPSSLPSQVFLMFDADPAGRGAGLLISHNTIEYSALARGIALSGMSGVTIADNAIAYTQQAGVVINNDLYDGFGPNFQVRITGNNLQNVNSGMAGIGGGLISDNSLTCTSSNPTAGEDPHLPSGPRSIFLCTPSSSRTVRG
jgi:hypothetical protein